MLLDVRTYTCRPGTMKKQIAFYEKNGLAPQKRHFGEPLVYATAESGDVNTYMHIWVYEDVNDRAKKRAALMQDPDWLTYLEKSGELNYLLKQESKLMTPLPFAPIKR